MSIDWKAVTDEVRNSLKDFFAPRGIKPTLRTMFYRLYSLQMIPNTTSSYKGLIKKMVEARKAGLIRFDAFSDGAKRTVTGTYSDECVDPIDDARSWLGYIRSLVTTTNYSIGKWHRQPNYVEVWIEKDALASTFESFLREQEVFIAVNKGYSSWTFMYDNITRLQAQIDKGKKVHVLYFGDFDPSGLDMESGHLTNAMDFFGVDASLQRVAITLDQIDKYRLPEAPEEQETIAKAHRDPRHKRFVEQYGRLILVELDAMLALAPDDFMHIVQESVDRFFDYALYNEVLDLEKENAMKKQQYLSDHIALKE